MPYMNLPPGNRALRMYDGTSYRAAREGGRVEIADRHVADINAMGGNGTAGLLTAGFREFGAVKKAGRWCKSCQPARLWQPWSTECPRCGAATEPEES